VCCTPQNTCANNGLNCGTVSDDCGGTLNCGTCPTGQICVNNVCKVSQRTGTADHPPPPYRNHPMHGGRTADGCVGTLNCGNCTGGQTCINNVCTGCTPYTCAGLGFNCGSASDGCGGTLNCGKCKKGKTCVNNVCK